MEYNWIISALDCVEDKDFGKVVTSVHWRLSCTKDGVTTDVYGQEELPPPSEGFKAYEELTKEEVVSWLESTIESIDDIKADLERLVSIKKEKVSLPFAN